MSKYLIKKLDLLMIEKKGKIFYGASQDWYPKFIQRRAGCGPTTATNLLIYLAKSDEYFSNLFPDDINYQTVLNKMNEIWYYITPGKRGVNSIEIFESGIYQYAREHGVNLNVHFLKIKENNKVSEDTLETFLYEQITKNRPVAFLNLSAGMVTNLSNWHWVLVVGLEKEDNKLFAYLYDEGEAKKINLSLWLKSMTNDGGFITFSSKYNSKLHEIRVGVLSKFKG